MSFKVSRHRGIGPSLECECCLSMSCWQARDALFAVRAKPLQLCLTLWDPMDSSPPGFSVHGILHARILERTALPSSRGSSRPRDRTRIFLCLLHWQAGSSPLVPPGKPCASCKEHAKTTFLGNKHMLGQKMLKTAFVSKSGRFCAPALTNIGLGGRRRCLFSPQDQSVISRWGWHL